jgi:hypothetical protein
MSHLPAWRLVLLPILALKAANTSGATLSASFASVPAGSVIKLTPEGALDWIHWGLFTDTSLTRKATVPPLLPDFTTLGSTSNYTYVYQFADNQNSYSWEDGKPFASASTTSGVWAYNFTPVGSGFELNVPADTTVKVLKVYVGAYDARGRLTAALSDGSATGYTNTSLFNFGNGPNGVYTITYAAASAGQTLQITWTVSTPLGGIPNVTLQAATLSASGANNPPYGSIVSPTNNYNATAGANLSIQSSATDSDGNVTNVEFFAGATLLGNQNIPPYIFIWTNAPIERHIITARFTDNAGSTSTTSPVEVFVHGAGGSLNGSLTAVPTTADLTTEGASDWAHWGLLATNSFDRKSGVSPQLSDVVWIGDGLPSRLDDFATSFSWSDGTPTLFTNGVTSGVFVTASESGFEITAPAGTSPRTLRLYLGLYGTKGNLRAWLSDLSAPAWSDASLDPVFNNVASVCTLNYSSAASGQTLHVRFTSAAAYDTDFGNVAIASATLVGDLASPMVTLIDPRFDIDKFSFSFQTQPGWTFAAQFTESPSPTSWQTFANVIGDGSLIRVTNAIGNTERRFYRVVGNK